MGMVDASDRSGHFCMADTIQTGNNPFGIAAVIRLTPNAAVTVSWSAPAATCRCRGFSAPNGILAQIAVLLP